MAWTQRFLHHTHDPLQLSPGELEGGHSLGSIFVANKITDTLVKANSNTHKRIGHLAVIGLQNGESENRYPPPPTKLIRQLLEVLRDMATFVVIDCSSYLFAQRVPERYSGISVVQRYTSR